MRYYFRILCLMFLLLPSLGIAQNQFVIHLSNVNISQQYDLLHVQIISTANTITKAKVSGNCRVLGTNAFIKYEKEVNLSPGLNNLQDLISLSSLQFSDVSLKELYSNYKMLPLGKIEYCVQIELLGHIGEGGQWNTANSECTVFNNIDGFMIELLDPEDNAKLTTYNPQLSWLVNSPLLGNLTYRLMVAPIQKGQSKLDAIRRNAMVYDEKNIPTTVQIYPIYAKALVQEQKYAWNVEAYYKGILIGTAKPWSFIILPTDSIDSSQMAPSYVDISGSVGNYVLTAPGQVKLKYYFTSGALDTLQFRLVDHNGKEVKMKLPHQAPVIYGDNRIVLDFYEYQPLKHNKNYTLFISSSRFRDKRLNFKYINPDLLKK